MELFKQITDLIGYIGTFWLFFSGLLIFIAWLKGIIIPVWRMGNGLAKRKITIFAKGDNKESFRDLLLDTNLFNCKNIQIVTKQGDIERCEDSTLFLVIWDDFGVNIDDILRKKKNNVALIIFAKPNQLQENDWKKIDSHHNITVVNFKGRLLNDMLVSLMVTGYEKR